ncbi:PREDICTED: uncharacterized protein LOC104803750 [Tarenaya hassleriana]|uniref:uncharacterized protein LOC104803750 n=1 Tax=Tarenaya hassleriana TaxID=28532 RepID=UPI00053C1F30|nr:PREDICTED: uncharacterized protein LOC104803750 [Tarenaya hassleriana]
MEVCSTVATKKLASMAKLILFTIQKVSETSRHKLLSISTVDLLKRGKILRKSLNDAVSVSHSRLSCRPTHDDVHASFISPVPILEYEFSCSSTPPRRSYTPVYVRRKPISKRHMYLRYNTLPKARDVRHVAVVEVASNGTAGSCHVDRDAEEFIQRFYRQLRLQKWMMAQDN